MDMEQSLPKISSHVVSVKTGIESIPYIDDLIREYLLFRGFKSTLKAFEEDINKDPDQGFRSANIVNELLKMAQDLRIEELIDYWRYLTHRFFSHLSSKYNRTIKMFEKRLLRLFLISAVQKGKRTKIRKFMDLYGRELCQQGDWIPWLGIEYIEDPANRPEFEAYFNDEWFVSLKVALSDFIQTIFPAMAVPRILLFDKDRKERERLERRVKQYEEYIDNETKIKSAVLVSSAAGLVENHIEDVRTATSKSLGKQAAVDTLAGGGSVECEGAIGDDVIQTNELSEMLKISQEEVFLEHNSGISLAKFSAAGDLIASYDDESILKVWSPDADSQVPRSKFELDYTVLSMAWDKRHSHLLYLYDEDGYIHTLNTNTSLMNRQLVFERKYPWLQEMLCSPTSSAILTISSTKPENISDISVRIWDASANKAAASKRMTLGSDSHAIDASFNHNGNLIALVHSTGRISLIDTRTLESAASFRTKERGICAGAFSLDEDSVMLVSDEGKLTQWSLHKPGQMLAESHLNLELNRDGSSSSNGPLPQELKLDRERVAFTPGRDHVLAAPSNQCLVFNIDSASTTDSMRRHKDLVSCIDFAADRALSAAEDGTIQVAKFRAV